MGHTRMFSVLSTSTLDHCGIQADRLCNQPLRPSSVYCGMYPTLSTHQACPLPQGICPQTTLLAITPGPPPPCALPSSPCPLDNQAVDVAAQRCRLRHLLHTAGGHLRHELHYVQRQLVCARIRLHHLRAHPARIQERGARGIYRWSARVGGKSAVCVGSTSCRQAVMGHGDSTASTGTATKKTANQHKLCHLASLRHPPL